MTITSDLVSAPKSGETARLDMAGVPFPSQPLTAVPPASRTSPPTLGGTGWWAIMVVLILLGAIAASTLIRSHNIDAASAAKTAIAP